MFEKSQKAFSLPKQTWPRVVHKVRRARTYFSQTRTLSLSTYFYFNRHFDEKFAYVLISSLSVFPGVKNFFVLKSREYFRIFKKKVTVKNLDTHSYKKRKYTRFHETIQNLSQSECCFTGILN